MKDDKITGEDYLLIENAFLEGKCSTVNVHPKFILIGNSKYLTFTKLTDLGAKLTTTEITKIMKANKNSEVEVVVVMS